MFSSLSLSLASVRKSLDLIVYRVCIIIKFLNKPRNTLSPRLTYLRYYNKKRSDTHIAFQLRNSWICGLRDRLKLFLQICRIKGMRI